MSDHNDGWVPEFAERVILGRDGRYTTKTNNTMQVSALSVGLVEDYEPEINEALVTFDGKSKSVWVALSVLHSLKYA